MSTVTHVGFADESRWNDGQYRSVALVSCPLNILSVVEAEARQLLSESRVSELKWKNLKGARERFAAEKLSYMVVERAYAGDLRVDVLIWDMLDSRHGRVLQPDDAANLGRMYYHLMGNVLTNHWPNEANWRIHPDEHGEMDWNSLQGFLAQRSVEVIPPDLLSDQNRFRFEFRSVYDLGSIAPVDSKMHPLVQIADLFAGMAIYSRMRFVDFAEWRKRQSSQQALWDAEVTELKLSGSDRERFPLLDAFDQACKRRKLGVSIQKTRGLKTFDPKNPLNFWLYEPQHSSDRAPSRMFP